MTEPKKYSKPYRNKRNRKKHPVKISREDIEKALNDYLEKGGSVIKLAASDDHRPVNDRPFDPMDTMWKQWGA